MTMPLVFIGHGSPMNIVADNRFTQSLRQLGQKIPKPKSILAISAHWQTPQTQVLVSTQPKTIYDFTGFPKELYEVSYPALGAPELAMRVQQLTGAESTEAWGLDHGTWAVLVHLFPNADVPVTQLSLARNISFEQHFKLGEALAELRNEGVLVLGSGNIVHNLREIQWEESAPAFDWAIEFDEKIKQILLQKDFKSLCEIREKWPELARHAHPTPEHYLPLLYVAGAASADMNVSFPHEEIQNASISMRSVLFS